MNYRVQVTTGARLHFGLLSHHPVGGRRFGGAGLMIDSPGFQIEATRSDFDDVEVMLDEGFTPREEFGLRLRATEFQVQYCWKTCLKSIRLPHSRIVIRHGIPSHAGLGSGTQLGMAVAKALSVLSGQGKVDPSELARRVERGARSALGIHGFEQGGFLVDGGKADGDDGIGALAARAKFPEKWRVIVVTPPGTVGVSGEAERKAFERLAPMSAKTTEKLRQMLLNEMLPAVVNADFDGCGELLFEFGRRVGEYFSSVQEGTFADARMGELVGCLRQQGIRGVGQTSWGPSLFVLMPNQREAELLVAELSRGSRWSECRFRVARALNRGAAVEQWDD